MVNRRYRKGYRFEHRVKRYLEKLGYKVFRLAGSKPIDLIAIGWEGGDIYYIECKTTRYTKRTGNKLIEIIGERPGVPVVAYRDEYNKIKFYDPKNNKEIKIPNAKDLDKFDMKI